ncbi:hypothetical protein KIH27_09995 [Mycobacterium sp. M1]|uniref:Glyoxalase-like domain-containing protein n=2 Tax=Mycolicibacter acidiphilus TaxID=2835306 RepID=A0ABS5RI21_9MYCO|nr:hypothetical protein [Mycolicibacter acidiphilus]
MQAGGSPNGPGGAIANVLCGGWDHPPPCPLAPHHVSNQVRGVGAGAGDEVVLRVLFAADPADEQRVRQLIDCALAGGEVIDPDGNTVRWQLKSTGAGCVRPDEEDRAAHLVAHR